MEMCAPDSVRAKCTKVSQINSCYKFKLFNDSTCERNLKIGWNYAEFVCCVTDNSFKEAAVASLRADDRKGSSETVAAANEAIQQTSTVIVMIMLVSIHSNVRDL